MTFERNVKGLLGTKLGMTQLWDENNRIVPVTVVAAGTNVVTQVRTPETDGYNAIQVGFGEIEGRKVTKPSAGHFAKAGVTARRHLAEIRTADAASYQVGQELSPELFTAGDDVDVTGTSKGKGYAGTMKRHGFAGVGVLIPRFSGDQYNAGRHIPQDQARRGDLIFYGPNGSQHVTMYLGNGQMLEASGSAAKVTVSSVRKPGMTPFLTRIIEY